MAQDANTVPPKGYGSLSGKDFWKGALVVAFPHLVAMATFLIKQDHWPTWPEWQPYVEISVLTFLTYIGKNFATNNTGQLFTKDKPTVKVDADKLKQALDDDAVG